MNNKEIQAGLSVTPGYYYAKQIGAQLFVSGQVPNDVAGDIVGINDPYAQAKQCLNNLELLLTVHNFQCIDIKQLTIYVVGKRSNLHSAWNAVSEKFSEAVPPATLLGVNTLGYDKQLVEIDAVVVKGP